MPGKKRDAAVVVQEEENFIRGGGSGLAPIVHKQIKEDVYKEVEAELFGSSSKGRGKKRRKDIHSDDEEADEEDAFFRSLAAQDKIPKYVELLKFKSLNEGTKLWGAVVEILPRELVISLPHGLRGHVAYQDASEMLAKVAPPTGKGNKPAPGQVQLSELFHIGQLVRCAVSRLRDGSGDDDNSSCGAKKKQQRKRVDLTLHVSKVNSGLSADSVREGAALPACVKSVEDHGYVLSFGIKGTTGFLPKKDAPKALLAGSIVDVVVNSVKSGGHSFCTAEPAAVASAATKEWDGLNIGTLLPGALVNARVRHVLSDGLLVSFLTFFTGTIDPFHLGPTQKFSENQRIRARVLFVDAASKRVGLTLQRSLLDWNLPTNFPTQGQSFSAAVVKRVDPGLGLLVELGTPEGEDSDAAPVTPGYAHISNLSDQKVEKLEGRFRIGQVLGARVIGLRPMDGLAAVSLKASVLEQSFLSLDAITPGMRVSGTVTKSEEGMLLVALTPQLRALVPALHMSDAASSKAYKKFKEGQKVSGRVLQIDPSAKKVVVTLKPALVDSKLPILAKLEDAVPGSKAHGVITGVQPYGIFVTFFNDLSGLVPVAELGLPEGQTPQTAFAAGNVVKVRVVGVDAKKNRLKLSMMTKKKTAAAVEEAEGLGGLQPGDKVTGVVTVLHKIKANKAENGGADDDDDEAEEVLSYAEVALHKDGQIGEKPIAVGRLEAAHLSDHPAAAAALGEALAVGSRFDGLLILQRLETAKQLRVTRKASLVDAAAAGKVPNALKDLAEGATYPGYVASIAADGVFVRFLGDLTGRAGLAQLSDTFVSDPHAVFSVGQSVRAQIAQIDSTKGRFSLTLKRSLCSAGDAAILRSFFQDSEVAAALTHSAEGGEAAEIDYSEAFALGSKVQGRVHGVRDYGTLCDLEAHSDVVGIAAPHQVSEEAPSTEGAPITAVVLDYNEHQGIVDLSMRGDLLEKAESAAGGPPKKKKSKKEAKNAATAECKVGEKLSVTVELAKPEEGYAVVSLPQGYTPWLGFLATADFNEPLSSAAQLQPGDVVSATVAAVPSADTRGRLLFSMPASAVAAHGKNKSQSGKADGASAKKPRAPPGTKVTAKIDSVHALHADVSLDSGSRGRIFITEVADLDKALDSSPLSHLTQGSSIEAIVMGRMQSALGKRHGLLEFTCRPSILSNASPKTALGEQALSWDSLKPGQVLQGFAQEVNGEHLWVVFSPTIRGRVFLPQSCASPEECTAASKRYRPGTPVSATVLAVDAAKHALDVSLGSSKPAELKAGSTAVGIVVSANGTGVQIQLAPGCSGRVALSNIHDIAVKNALAGVKAGQFVKVGVLSVGTAKSGGKVAGGKRKKGSEDANLGSKSVELTLRPSRGGQCAAHKSASPVPSSGIPAPLESLNLANLKPGQRIAGYVKSAGSTGVFVCLSRNADARIKLRQLSEDFVENPTAAYPAGMYVEGSVVAVEAGKVELTLRNRRPPPSLENLEEGQVVRGRVKRIEKFGVFVELDAAKDAGPAAPAGPTGLAHLSELADAYVHDVDKLFKVDQRVVARVLGVDKTAGRLSLGLKPSYFEDLSDMEGDEEGDDDGEADLDEELAALGGSDEEEEGSELELAVGSDEEESSGEEEEEGEGSEEEPGSDFDLDEELIEAEAEEGESSEEEESDEEASE